MENQKKNNIRRILNFPMTELVMTESGFGDICKQRSTDAGVL